MRWTLLGFLFLLGCGGGGSDNNDSGGTGGSGTTSGGSGNSTGGKGSGSGGASSSGGTGSSTGGTNGSGGTGSPGTCDSPEAYSGAALTKGAWIDVTGSLSQVNNLWAVPNQDRVFASVPTNGLWAYTAAGGSWAQIATTSGMDVFAVVFDPCNGNRFWLAVNGGNGGAFYTEDGGATLTELGDIPGIRGIGVDLKNTNGQVLVAASSTGWPWDAGTGKAWTSNDAGATWTERTDAFVATNGTPFGYVYALSDQMLLASTIENGTFDGGGSRGGIWISTDVGVTWAQGPWVDGPRCATHAWCNYSGWNQPIGQPFVGANGEFWWVNAWFNSYFSTTDGGLHWIDNWGEYDHTIQAGGGHAIEIPTSVSGKTDSGSTTIIAIDNELGAEHAVVGVGISYWQPNKDGAGLGWWSENYLPYPVDFSKTDKTDQLAYDSVATALFTSTTKGGGSYVWMYPL